MLFLALLHTTHTHRPTYLKGVPAFYNMLYTDAARRLKNLKASGAVLPTTNTGVVTGAGAAVVADGATATTTTAAQAKGESKEHKQHQSADKDAGEGEKDEKDEEDKEEGAEADEDTELFASYERAAHRAHVKEVQRERDEMNEFERHLPRHQQRNVAPFSKGWHTTPLSFLRCYFLVSLSMRACVSALVLLIIVF